MTRENIARMSSKPMLKVQEEVASLQQLLSLVSNGLQRNSHVIDKLKTETAQVRQIIWSANINLITRCICSIFKYTLLKICY